MKKLSVEIVETPSKLAQGLKYREHLGEDEGMLFKFKQADNLRFWMQDTYIPLDIAFLDSDGEILQISEMYPKSTRVVVSENPCRYALEVNQGWFRKNKISIGDSVSGLDFSIVTSQSAGKIMKNPSKSRKRVQKDVGNKKQKQPIQPIQSNPVDSPIVDSPVDQMPVVDGQNEQPIDSIDPNNPMGQQDQANQTNQADQTQIGPKVEMMMDDRSKVRFAEQHNQAMQIVYQSKQSGQTLPPRKLIPVPGEGYPIRVGEGGEYFVAYDSSPTISGGEWQIVGNTPKRFLFEYIIALEVLDEFVE